MYICIYLYLKIISAMGLYCPKLQFVVCVPIFVNKKIQKFVCHNIFVNKNGRHADRHTFLDIEVKAYKVCGT